MAGGESVNGTDAVAGDPGVYAGADAFVEAPDFCVRVGVWESLGLLGDACGLVCGVPLLDDAVQEVAAARVGKG